MTTRLYPRTEKSTFRHSAYRREAFVKILVAIPVTLLMVVGIPQAVASTGVIGLPSVGSERLAQIGSAPQLPNGAESGSYLTSGTELHFDVVLDPTDAQALTSYASAVTDASSPEYHHYLTTSEFAQEFGASSSTVSIVRAELESEGLTPGATDADNLVVPVTGTVGAAARLSTRVSVPTPLRTASPDSPTRQHRHCPSTWHRVLWPSSVCLRHPYNPLTSVARVWQPTTRRKTRSLSNPLLHRVPRLSGTSALPSARVGPSRVRQRSVPPMLAERMATLRTRRINSPRITDSPDCTERTTRDRA